MQSSSTPSIHVLDIGVGASCIYPIIGAKLYGWTFTGTDIDEASATSSRHIVQHNSLLNIRVEHVEDTWQLQSVVYAVCSGREDEYSGVAADKGNILAVLLATRLDEAARNRGPIRRALEKYWSSDIILDMESAFMSSRKTPAPNVMVDPPGPGSQYHSIELSDPSTPLEPRSPVAFPFTLSMCNPPFYDLDEKVDSINTTYAGRS
jgi:hypothetical protein